MIQGISSMRHGHMREEKGKQELLGKMNALIDFVETN